MNGETMLDQYISHEMPFDQVRRLYSVDAIQTAICSSNQMLHLCTIS